MTGFDVDRFRAYQAEESYRATRTTEILGTVYAVHTPGKQACPRPKTAGLARPRPARRQRRRATTRNALARHSHW